MSLLKCGNVDIFVIFIQRGRDWVWIGLSGFWRIVAKLASRNIHLKSPCGRPTFSVAPKICGEVLKCEEKLSKPRNNDLGTDVNGGENENTLTPSLLQGVPRIRSMFEFQNNWDNLRPPPRGKLGRNEKPRNSPLITLRLALGGVTSNWSSLI